MKKFTKKYVENYEADKKTKLQLQKDVQIASALLTAFDVTPKSREMLHTLGSKATTELFSRYGDYGLWSEKYVDELPDTAFAIIESGGEKDEAGRTTPRSLRHLPFRDLQGNVDLPHIRHALSRLNSITNEHGHPIPEAVLNEVKKRLEARLEDPEIDIPQEVHKLEQFTETLGVHNVMSAEFSSANPKWLELTGILFHRGTHKGILYEDEHLKSAMLVPREGENLCYVDFYHNKEEGYKVGIMADIWWDDSVAWFCPTNNLKGKGALMYRSFITDRQAVSEVRDKKVGNVSAELHFNTYFQDLDNTKVETAIHVEINGKAITPIPALKAADIDTVCSMTEKGKRTCASQKNQLIK